ncbi:3586_t:CDS:2, partial [Racocetra persica]
APWKIEAIVLFLPLSETIDPNNQMQDALKISRLLRYDKLGIYCRKIEVFKLQNSPQPVFYNFCNMPFSLKKQLKNYFIVDFIPFEGYFDDMICLLLQELHQLEKGIVMKMNNELVWVIVSIRLVMADLPQDNDLSNVKKQDALYG